MKAKHEEWKQIDGFGGFYSVSNHGRVRSKERRVKMAWGERIAPERIMKGSLIGHGYLSVIFTFKGTIKRFYIHRLVGLYFVINPHNKPQINHINGDKLDNYFENLEWVTTKENLQHGFRMGLIPKDYENSNKNSMPVLKCDADFNTIREYPSLNEVGRVEGYKNPNIWYAIKNRTQSHGFYWKYKNAI